MEIKDIISRLEKSKQYKDWKKDHKAFFLAHIFKMFDEQNKDSWQVGYSNKKSDSIASFMVEKDNISLMDEEKPFHKPGSKISGLDLKNVKIDHDEAMKLANKLRKKKYPKEMTMKTFFILQNIDGKSVYNITHFTQTFNALNIKVSSEDGSIVKDTLTKFFKLQ